jgi:exoribonuclease R
VVRPAYVWRFELAPDGQVEAFDVVRALVRSRAKLAYAQVQAAADGVPPGTSAEAAAVAGDPDGLAAQAALLRRVGVLRAGLERARGGVNLDLPEQEVIAERSGFRLQLRAGLAAEDWNAQLSLMTGMAAARLMLDAGIGILRTLPPADGPVLDRFRRQAAALGLSWDDGEPLGSLLDRLDRTRPAHLALLHEAGSLFRGAAYTPLPAEPASTGTVHAAVAAPYAHVTAPLRRLVDRFGTEVCLALCAGREPAAELRAALPELPGLMAASDRRTREVERAVVDAVEAWVLRGREGQVFSAVVVDAENGKGTVTLDGLAVRGRCQGDALTPGTRVRVRLEEADVVGRRIRFRLVDGSPVGARSEEPA